MPAVVRRLLRGDRSLAFKRRFCVLRFPVCWLQMAPKYHQFSSISKCACASAAERSACWHLTNMDGLDVIKQDYVSKAVEPWRPEITLAGVAPTWVVRAKGEAAFHGAREEVQADAAQGRIAVAGNGFNGPIEVPGSRVASSPEPAGRDGHRGMNGRCAVRVTPPERHRACQRDTEQRRSSRQLHIRPRDLHGAAEACPTCPGPSESRMAAKSWWLPRRQGTAEGGRRLGGGSRIPARLNQRMR